MNILIASGHHSCNGQAGVTRIIIGIFSFMTLLKNFGIDEIVWKQIHLSLGFPSVDEFCEITRELASIPRSVNCFLTPNLLSHSVCWEGTLQ